MMILNEQYTEEQVQRIFSDMLDQFAEYQYDLDFPIDYVVKTVGWLDQRNRRTLGRCNYKGGKYYISLNPNILKFEGDGERIIRDTIAHEFCHTLPGCMNHGKYFHHNAKLINDLFGYHIDTKADMDSSDYFRKYLPQSEYMIRCNGCGKEFPVDRLSDPIKNPGKYTCKSCGDYFSSYVLDPQTGEYDLFKSADSEPDYKYKIVCPDCGYTFGSARNTKYMQKAYRILDNGGRIQCPTCGGYNLYLNSNGDIVEPW